MKRAVPTAGNVDDTSWKSLAYKTTRRRTHNDVHPVESEIKFLTAEAPEGVDSLIFDARVTAETQQVQFSKQGCELDKPVVVRVTGAGALAPFSPRPLPVVLAAPSCSASVVPTGLSCPAAPPDPSVSSVTPVPRPLLMALLRHGARLARPRGPHRPSLALQLLTPVRPPLAKACQRRASSAAEAREGQAPPTTLDVARDLLSKLRLAHHVRLLR